MRQGRPPFEVIEHTADVGVIAYGNTPAELMANVAQAMFHLMTDLERVEEKESRRISVQGHDWESLLVRWLVELLYYVDAQGLLFSRFQVEALEPYQLQAIALGERMDPEKHVMHMGIKGVTRHLLAVGQENGLWWARVIFDI
ncbi:MAG: archease [Dehalococcoidia bacterium]|nr:archease [Dehalococcoidia bacterium]